MVTFSVIMPSFNHERFISRAIESVLAQTYPDLELIIIDDRSEDDSRAIIDGWLGKDRRIKAAFHERNMGISRTMNEAIDMAEGKYLALFASDDLWIEHKLEAQLEVLRRDDRLVVWSEGYLVDGAGDVLGEKATERFGAAHKKKSGDLFHELLGDNYINGCSLVVKRASVERFGYDERLSYLNDYKLMLDLASSYKYHFIAEPLACYRIHEGSSNLFDRDSWNRDLIALEDYILAAYPGRLDRRDRALLHAKKSAAYRQLGRVRESLACLATAIALDPRQPKRWKDFFSIILERRPALYRLLKESRGALQRGGGPER